MFMLSETAFHLAVPVSQTPADTLDELERLEFDKQRAAADSLAKSIARRLLAMHDGQRVRLYFRTHELPFPGDVRAGMKLDDPSLFQERPWRELSREQ
jgi:hypothetical protein